MAVGLRGDPGGNIRGRHLDSYELDTFADVGDGLDEFRFMATDAHLVSSYLHFLPGYFSFGSKRSARRGALSLSRDLAREANEPKYYSNGPVRTNAQYGGGAAGK